MLNDVIKQVSQLKNINHVIVLTHNIDFLFLQSIFLNALRGCGHPSLTVFADAHCTRETYPLQSKLISGLGKRFRVIPVEMSHGYRFHPKAIFLAGDSDATLFIGSGNMTFGGLRQNAEVWKRFDTTSEDYAEINTFHDYLNALTTRITLDELIKDELFQIFSGVKNEWKENLSGVGRVISRVASEPPLIEQIQGVLINQNISKIMILTPYFDLEAEAIRALSDLFSTVPAEILLQSGKSTLSKEAAEALPENFSIKKIQFDRGNEQAEPFIHAKVFAFFSSNTVWVFAGSANSSKAAIIADGLRGNAELMAYEEMPVEDFEESFFKEIVITDEMPELLNHSDLVEEEAPDNAVGVVLTARFEDYKVRIVHKLPTGSVISKCLLDGNEYDFIHSDEHSIEVAIEIKPETAQIMFEVDGGAHSTAVMWVDDELALSSTAKGRDLLEKVRDYSRNNKIIKLDDWSLIAEIFTKDLNFSTAREIRSSSRSESADEEKENLVYVSKRDIFSESYDHLTYLNKVKKIGGASPDFFDLMLRMFDKDSAHADHRDNNEPNDDSKSHETGEQHNEGNGPEAVDKKEKIEIKKPEVQPKEEISKHQIKKVNDVAEKIRDGLTNYELLAIREPLRLSRDIQIAGLLYRKALSEGWLSEDQFFNLSQDIWSTLFLTTKSAPGKGWMNLRFDASNDKESFINSLRSPELAAVLYAWSDAMSKQLSETTNSKRFYLSVLMSIGRCQWLWYDDIDDEKFFNHLERIYSESPCGNQVEINFGEIHQERLNIFKRAIALARFETMLNQSGFTPVQLRPLLNSRRIEEGELLWQGKKRGLCITCESSYQKEKIKCISLQEVDDEVEFGLNSLIPVNDLLNSSVLSESSEFGLEQRQLIREIISYFAQDV